MFRIQSTDIRRGTYRLPPESQTSYRDLDAEHISRCFGGVELGLRRTADAVATCSDAIPLPYEYVVYVPVGHTLGVKGFSDRASLQAWLTAYDCRVEREPAAGEMFEVRLPDDAANWQPLVLPEHDELEGGARRTWTTTGERLADRAEAVAQGHATVAENVHSLRRVIVEAIPRLDWKPIAARHPAAPGLAVKQLVRELGLPGVDAVAYGVTVGRYDLLGVSAHYEFGDARVYAVDRGSDTLVVASDFRPHDASGFADDCGTGGAHQPGTE